MSVCMLYVCMYACMRVCVDARMYLCIYVSMHICIYVCAFHVYVYVDGGFFTVYLMAFEMVFYISCICLCVCLLYGFGIHAYDLSHCDMFARILFDVNE